MNKRHYNVIIIKNILWRIIVKSEVKKDFKMNDNLVVGRNAVIELIKSGREIENILIAKGEREGSVSKIIALAKEKGIVIKNVDKKKLDFISANANHQGVAANVPAHEYSSVDDILELARSRGNPLLLSFVMR